MSDKKSTDDNSTGGYIDSVIPGSPAAAAGIATGDILLSLNSHTLHDVIDYQFYFDPGPQTLEIEREGKRLGFRLDCDEGIDPGIRFSSTIFDRVRICRCGCIFCFVDQLPHGLRKSLYLKDDDYRLSFLHGNFITLNNLEEEDLLRIEEQRLSPLYVSVHSTEPDVRAAIMRSRRDEAAKGLENLARLGKSGITLHAQVVLCPEINDGAALEKTVTDLAEKYAGIRSVGVVPVALSEQFLEKRPAPDLYAVDAGDCRKTVGLVTARQKEYRTQLGCGFVYAADEFYLKAGLPLPPFEEYDDLPQYENGIGIAASFRREAEAAIGRIVSAGKPGCEPAGDVYLLTGTLARGVVEDVCETINRQGGLQNTDEGAGGTPRATQIRPLAVTNRIFGPNVTVTGLLGGREIIDAAQNARLTRKDLLLIPACCLSGSTDPRFLDDLTLQELDEALDCEIRIGTPYWGIPGHLTELPGAWTGLDWFRAIPQISNNNPQRLRWSAVT